MKLHFLFRSSRAQLQFYCWQKSHAKSPRQDAIGREARREPLLAAVALEMKDFKPDQLPPPNDSNPKSIAFFIVPYSSSS